MRIHSIKSKRERVMMGRKETEDWRGKGKLQTEHETSPINASFAHSILWGNGLYCIYLSNTLCVLDH